MVHGDNAWGHETLRAFFSRVGEADIIIGYTRQMSRSRTWTRTVCSKTFTLLVNLITKRRLRYFNGLQIHRAAVLKRLEIESSGCGFQAEVLVKALRLTNTYLEVPMDLNERQRGESKAFRLTNVVDVGAYAPAVARDRADIDAGAPRCRGHRPMIPSSTDPFRQQHKIVPVTALSAIRERFRDKAVVLCHGAFDLVHMGHLIHFEEARSLGDVLVVTITADAHITKKRAVSFSQEYRARQLAALEHNLFAEKAYPQQSERAFATYQRYVDRGKTIRNLCYAGRHAEFKYWGMPETVNAAYRKALAFEPV